MNRKILSDDENSIPLLGIQELRHLLFCLCGILNKWTRMQELSMQLPVKRYTESETPKELDKAEGYTHLIAITLKYICPDTINYSLTFAVPCVVFELTHAYTWKSSRGSPISNLQLTNLSHAQNWNQQQVPVKLLALQSRPHVKKQNSLAGINVELSVSYSSLWPCQMELSHFLPQGVRYKNEYPKGV